MEREMGMGLWSCLMEIFTKVSGLMDKNTGRGFISRKKLIHIIKVNSRKEKKLGSGFLKLLKKNSIKVSSKSLLKRAQGYNCFQMATYI